MTHNRESEMISVYSDKCGTLGSGQKSMWENDGSDTEEVHLR